MFETFLKQHCFSERGCCCGWYQLFCWCRENVTGLPPNVQHSIPEEHKSVYQTVLCLNTAPVDDNENDVLCGLFIYEKQAIRYDFYRSRWCMMIFHGQQYANLLNVHIYNPVYLEWLWHFVLWDKPECQVSYLVRSTPGHQEVCSGGVPMLPTRISLLSGMMGCSGGSLITKLRALVHIVALSCSQRGLDFSCSLGLNRIPDQSKKQQKL